MRKALGILLIALTLALLGACGGDDNNNTQQFDVGSMEDAETQADAQEQADLAADLAVQDRLYVEWYEPDAQSDLAPQADLAVQDRLYVEWYEPDAQSDLGVAADREPLQDGESPDMTPSDAPLPDSLPGTDLLPQADANGACNDLPNDGPEVAETQVAEEPPAPAGGSIEEGLYTLTSSIIYTGPGGETGQTGFVSQRQISFQGNVVQGVMTSGGEDYRSTATFTVEGTSLLYTFTCSPGGPPTMTFGFTATPTQILLIRDDAGEVTVDTYDK